MRKKNYLVAIPKIEQTVFDLPPYFEVMAINAKHAEELASIIIHQKKTTNQKEEIK